MASIPYVRRLLVLRHCPVTISKRTPFTLHTRSNAQDDMALKLFEFDFTGSLHLYTVGVEWPAPEFSDQVDGSRRRLRAIVGLIFFGQHILNISFARHGPRQFWARFILRYTPRKA